MADPSIAIGFLAFVFGIHIALVNIDIGLAVIIPFLKRYGETKGNELFVSEAKKYMKYFAIVYATAGVYATAFTVFLLAFFPEFLWLGGIALLIPFGLAVVFVALRLFSISAYWYTWNKLNSNYHFYLGLILASTSFIIPLMFRSVFAFLNNPIGVESLDPLVIDWFKVYTNPTLWPLYLKSIAGAFSATFFMLVTVYAYRVYKGIGEKDDNLKFIKLYLNNGMWLLFLMVIFGFWYLASLSAATPYKFSNIVGVWFGVSPQGTDYSWLFILKMLLVSYQVFVIIYILQTGITKEKVVLIEGYNIKLLMGIGPAAVLTIVLGEYLNAFSQLPYFIAQPGLEDSLPMINVFNSINPLAALFDVYSVTIFAIIPLLLAFFVLLYYLLGGKLKNSY